MQLSAIFRVPLGPFHFMFRGTDYFYMVSPYVNHFNDMYNAALHLPTFTWNFRSYANPKWTDPVTWKQQLRSTSKKI